MTRKGSCSCHETPSTFSYHHYAHDHVDSAVLDHMVKMPASHRTPSCWEPISFGDGGTELASPWSAVLSPACATASGSCWHQGYRRKEAVACRRSRGVASRLPPPRHHQSTTVRRPRPAPLIDQDSGRRKRRARGGQRPKTKSERLAFRCRAGVRAISTGGSGVGRHQPTRQRLTGTNATGRAGRRSRRTESERARKAAGGRAAALVGDHQTAGPQSSVHAS